MPRDGIRSLFSLFLNHNPIETWLLHPQKSNELIPKHCPFFLGGVPVTFSKAHHFGALQRLVFGVVVPSLMDQGIKAVSELCSQTPLGVSGVFFLKKKTYGVLEYSSSIVWICRRCDFTWQNCFEVLIFKVATKLNEVSFYLFSLLSTPNGSFRRQPVKGCVP